MLDINDDIDHFGGPSEIAYDLVMIVLQVLSLNQQTFRFSVKLSYRRLPVAINPTVWFASRLQIVIWRNPD